MWAGVEGDQILIGTGTDSWKAKDMQRDPRVSLSVVDLNNPYRMAAVQGRVITMRPDPDNAVIDALAHKYTGKPFPLQRGPNQVCFVIEVQHAGQRTLGFEHRPGEGSRARPALFARSGIGGEREQQVGQSALCWTTWLLLCHLPPSLRYPALTPGVSPHPDKEGTLCTSFPGLSSGAHQVLRSVAVDSCLGD